MALLKYSDFISHCSFTCNLHISQTEPPAGPPRTCHSSSGLCSRLSSTSHVLFRRFKSYLPILRLDSNAPYSIKPSRFFQSVSHISSLKRHSILLMYFLKTCQVICAFALFINQLDSKFPQITDHVLVVFIFPQTLQHRPSTGHSHLLTMIYRGSTVCQKT